MLEVEGLHYSALAGVNSYSYKPPLDADRYE
jgi:hypothetical protein